MADPPPGFAGSNLLVDTSEPPDVMNDPHYEVNNAGGENGAFDSDTCRICREKGTDSEPLFHPCKCNGSIKHVHQDCLMTWLGHTNKKHCELCKTPFRFTKLYSPNMPQSLPAGVFFQHFVSNSMQNLATWMRFCLVVAVWLGCLPYVIRQVWRVLFWLSDGGWPSQYLTIDSTQNSTELGAFEVAQALQLAANGTCPANPFYAAQTTPASVGGLMNQLVGYLPFYDALKNLTSADPLVAGLFKSIYHGLGLQNMQNIPISEGPISNTSVSHIITNMNPAVRSPSLLSNVSFLRHLTRFSQMNQLFITIAEGYIITILVVVSFILVFLIREWVVQQQPNINMGAAFDAEIAAPDLDQANDDHPHRDAVDGPRPGDEVEGRALARPLGWRPRGNRELLLGLDDIEENDALGLVRPAAIRDALTPAAEIHKQLTEAPRMTDEFLAIWRRAESDPQEVLRIIERENKADEMSYWVNAMKIMRRPVDPDDGDPGSSASGTVQSQDIANTLLPYNHSTDSLLAEVGSDRASVNGESWADVPEPLTTRLPNTSPDGVNGSIDAPSFGLDKGKGKAQDELPERSDDFSTSRLPGINAENGLSDIATTERFSGQSSHSLLTVNGRSRAVSDGPPLKDSISPLASHSWSANVNNLMFNENINPRIGGNQPFTGEPAMASGNETAETNKPITNFKMEKWDARKSAQDQSGLEMTPKIRGELASQTLESSSNGRIVVRPSTQESQTSRKSSDTFSKEFDATPEPMVDIHYDTNRPRAIHPVDSEDEYEPTINTSIEAEENPFAPDTLLPSPREPIIARPVEPQGHLANIADWLWGNGENEIRLDTGVNDEHIVEDLAAEAPFVPVANFVDVEQDNNVAQQDRDVVEAAFAAGLDPNDPDAIDDAEDFEGIMELVGMRGPVYNLIQNALFSAFLLALTVAFGVWIPYQIGRVSLLLIANPGPALKLPLRFVFWFAAFLQDVVVSVMGVVSWLFVTAVSLPINLWNTAAGDSKMVMGTGWASASLRISREAIDRIMEGTISSLLNFTDSEIFAFSAASHESLLTLKYFVLDTVEEICGFVTYVLTGNYGNTFAGIQPVTAQLAHDSYNALVDLPSFIFRPDSWVISLEYGKRATPLDLELSVWATGDRIWATLAGYTALSFLGAMYVKKGAPFSTGQVGRDLEATIIDLLNQAGGVMKVILIISIEMLVFPLYCGLLLDAALLPLFEGASLMSRLLFTLKSPCTSIFVHWFVGTCYMFHFALFVSMCRKIMRKGVLYFIRDPDDPTFHPVRDVLERNVATQLRKILFSALVYGALVVICLGGVVWGLAFAFKGVLPIHWSSNEPVLEFPIDLLFYNFLMPLAVKFFKPSDALHEMYTWWFRQCARMLRLTWFMFDERKQDEEGYIVRRSWKYIFQGLDGNPLPVYKPEDSSLPFIADPTLNAYILQDGRYVRAPASDQVRVKKGLPIFLDVDEHNHRFEGQTSRPAGDADWDSDLYKQVYVPPNFRLRIFGFILFIWLFAALTGVCITIVPLVFGREVFSMIIPPNVRKNDVYAFSIGIYILGSALYLILHARKFITYLRASWALNAQTPGNILRLGLSITTRLGKILWTYSAALFLLPTLCTFVAESYVILPLHTYFAPNEIHTIHFVQSWTLGLLYVKLIAHLIQWYPESRPAIRLQRVVRHGYLNPDAGIATRAFILPATLVFSSALLLPWPVARILVALSTHTEQEKVRVYRFIYPAVLAIIFMVYCFYLLAAAVRGWRMRIRDEVYLIGERLHNFGERKAGSGSGTVGIGVRRIDT